MSASFKVKQVSRLMLTTQDWPPYQTYENASIQGIALDRLNAARHDGTTLSAYNDHLVRRCVMVAANTVSSLQPKPIDGRRIRFTLSAL
ncbi:hypothetical protein O9992_00270 [Vibrio lentus]|nr:hypothetical protein [Vibrio lentus]